MKGNSLDDGPGIRTVVFFKGCPLSCVWCHNPESKRASVELAYDPQECINCNSCIATCSKGALSLDNAFFVDRTRCNLCFACVDACPTGALTRMGESYSVGEILAKILPDRPFFENSGGGVTLSGGEPTLHMDFLARLVQALKQEGVHVLLETCGYFPFSPFLETVHPFLDQVYFDLKLIDPSAHEQYCGISNETILANFERLITDGRETLVPVLPRVPLIPEITTTESNLRGIAQFLEEMNQKRVALLEYNPTWLAKASKLGRVPQYCKTEFMTREEITRCKSFFTRFEIL